MTSARACPTTFVNKFIGSFNLDFSEDMVVKDKRLTGRYLLVVRVEESCACADTDCPIFNVDERSWQTRSP